MKTSELLPQELVTATVNLIRGALSQADNDYLRDKCQLDIDCLWFCDDGSFELDLKNGSCIDVSVAVSLFNYTRPYLQSACLMLLDELGSQLPEWTYDSDKFCFNWGMIEDVSLSEFDAAYQRVWDTLFDGKRLTGPPAALEMNILQTMLSESLSQQGLPSWLKGGVGTKYANVHLDRNFLRRLSAIYQDYTPEAEPAAQTPVTINTQESYVSPFTGKPC